MNIQNVKEKIKNILSKILFLFYLSERYKTRKSKEEKIIFLKLHSSHHYIISMIISKNKVTI